MDKATHADPALQCPENHPDCTQCTKRGLTCEWPEIQIEQTGNDGKRIARAIPRQVDSPNTFSMEDFRLFNHFVKECHPSHPLGNEERWTHDIPSIAHNVRHFIITLDTTPNICRNMAVTNTTNSTTTYFIQCWH